jgi:hypothetical protein
VYLDGELDDGVLLGPVTGRQRSARVPLSVGSRSDVGGFEFAGALADVRIYSRPLTRAEIVADMRGAVIADSGAPRAPATHPGDPCAVSTDREDARIPGVAAALGALAAVTCVGLRPSAGALLGLGASAAAGLLLFPATVSTLPPADLAMLPLLGLAGGASVAISVRRVFD